MLPQKRKHRAIWGIKRKKMTSGIYLIRSKTDGKVYVGRSKNIESRLSGHRADLRYQRHRNIYLQRAFNQHGAENFEFTTLEITDNHKEREIHWIAVYNSLDKEKGYNLVDEQNDKRIFSREHRDKIGAARRGKKLSEETKKRMSNARMGIVWSEERNRKISVALKGRCTNPSSCFQPGRKLSQAQIEKQRASIKRYYETHSAHNKGKPVSDEMKHNLSIKLKTYFANKKASQNIT